MTYDVQSPDAVRVWAYTPDWQSGFDVRRSFKTDIATSRSGTEQRRALRANPRFSIEYATMASEADLRDANHFLRTWQNKPTVVPDFARWARIDGAAIVGATSIDISPLPVWAAAGQNLVLCAPGGAMERVLVDSVAGTTLTLTDPLALAWADQAVARPTFFGLMESKIGSARRNRGAAEFQITLDAYPGGEPPREEGTPWATLNDREVFTLVPDYLGPPSVSAVWPVERIDYEIGRTAQFRPIDRGQSMVEADFKHLTTAQAAECEQFFDRMKGRRGAFYLPTWEKDFVLAATAGSGTSTMLASGTDLAADFGSTDYADVEEAMAVWLMDGTAIYRGITDIGSSGGNSQITVDSPWGVDLTQATVARISRMPLVRFAADEMTISWRTTRHADVRLSFQGIRA